MSEECEAAEPYGYDWLAVRKRFYEPSYNAHCEKIQINRSGHMNMLDWMALDTIMPQMRYGLPCGLPLTGYEMCHRWMLWP